MGAPDSGMQAAEQSMADSLLTAFRTIKSAERQKHASVLDYWLSIRGDKEFPPLHDLDPLEISDAGPNSILLELIGGGQDAEIRHLGEALASDVSVSRIIDAPNPSLLSSIARKLPIVSISREFLAFEDSFNTSAGMTRCWVTLLPLSSCGSWVDYVYAFVSVDSTGSKAATAPATDVIEDSAAGEIENIEAVPEESNPDDEVAEVEAGTADVEDESAEDAPSFPADELGTLSENDVEPLELAEQPEATETAEELEPELETVETTAAKSGPGFSRILDGIANLTGFYGQGVNVDSTVPTMELADSEPVEIEPQIEGPDAIPTPDAVVEEPTDDEADAGAEDESHLVDPDGAAPDIEPDAAETASGQLPEESLPELSAPQVEPRSAPVLEGPLQDQLAQVRAKAEEARQAQLRVAQALHESLSAAYDFALDAEGSPEEYLRLVEAQGVRIQLRSPMAPVARMAFDDVCDAATIRQFEAVLAWALKVELPRGALLERIESAGGIPELLNEFSKAA
jgi:hypothetical protein